MSDTQNQFEDFFAKQTPNGFILINPKYYDEMIRNTDDINVMICKSDNTVKISFNEEKLTDTKAKIFECEHKRPWRQGGFYETGKCKYCVRDICKICGIDGCCSKHIPFIVIEGSGIKIIGIPTDEIWVRAVYFSDLFKMKVIVEPFRTKNIN